MVHFSLKTKFVSLLKQEGDNKSIKENCKLKDFFLRNKKIILLCPKKRLPHTRQKPTSKDRWRDYTFNKTSISLYSRFCHST